MPCSPAPRSPLLAPLVACLVGVALTAAPPARAEPDQAQPAAPLRWSGFGTLGVTHHDNDGAGVIHNFSQRRPAESGWQGNLDSVLGLQLDARLLETTSAAVQGAVRAGDDFRPRLRMAYVRQGFGRDFAARLGRLRSPLFIDSDVGEIGYAYLTVRPNLPLYAAVVNNVPYLDGGDIQWRHAFGPAALLLQGYFGQSAYRQRFYNTTPRSSAWAETKGILGLAVSLSLPQVTVRASHTRTDRFTMRSAQLDELNAGLAQGAGGLGLAATNPLLPPPLQAALNAQAAAVLGYSNPFDSRPVYSSIGFDATLHNWRLMGESARFDSNSAMVGRMSGWSATLGYTLGEFTPYVTASHNERKSPPLDTSALAATNLSPALDAGLAQTKAVLDDAARFADLSARSAGIGLRWDARANLAVKIQYERLRTPSANHPGVFAARALPFEPVVNLFSATLDFVF